MRVLVGCEFSGRIRDAFIQRRHDAISCNLKPTIAPGPHIIGDVLDHLSDGWDLGIFNPPCTDICVSGARYFQKKRADGRQGKAIRFFMDIADCDIPKICIENPIGIMSGNLGYLKEHFPDLYERATALPKPQIIQPWQYGDPESKSTCLWLKNLPMLKPTNILKIPDCGYWNNQTPSRQNKLGPSKDRADIRSITYKGIAAAMADQWGNLSNNDPHQLIAVNGRCGERISE